MKTRRNVQIVYSTKSIWKNRSQNVIISNVTCSLVHRHDITIYIQNHDTQLYKYQNSMAICGLCKPISIPFLHATLQSHMTNGIKRSFKCQLEGHICHDLHRLIRPNNICVVRERYE